MALAQTCWDRGPDSHHVPAASPYGHLEQAEIAFNVWEATCVFCGKKIHKRTDDAGLFIPWTSPPLVIVEWP